MKEMFDDWVEDKQASFYVGGLMSRAMDLEEIDHMRQQFTDKKSNSGNQIVLEL